MKESPIIICTNKKIKQVPVVRLLEGVFLPAEIQQEKARSKARLRMKIEGDPEDMRHFIDAGHDIHEKLKDISKKQDHDSGILKDIQLTSYNLETYSHRILKRLRKQDQKLIAAVSKTIEEKATGSENTIKEVLIYLQRAVDQLNQKAILTEEENQELIAITEAKDLEGDLKGKFKLALPIIPGIMKYEKELSFDLRSVFKAMLEEFRAGNVFFMD